MYRFRILSPALRRASKSFSVLMVTGARQVGKTTLLRHIEAGRRFVTLDDMDVRRLAKEDPEQFLERYPPPVFIDEFQYAPEILPYIKIRVDEKRTRMVRCAGEYWLSGSQNFGLMKGVAESLAGRVAVFDLPGFSLAEALPGRKEPGKKPFFEAFGRDFETRKSVPELFDAILKGDKPDVWVRKSLDRGLFYSSYVQTYLERDVRSQLGVRHLGHFEKFMRLIAARVGQLMNMAKISSELGVSIPTVKEWLAVLERSDQIFVLPPYSGSISKRLVRTPKVYFLDSGLAAHLLRWQDVETALAGPMAGQLFENWAVSEIVKSYRHRGARPDLYFWRTKEGQEFDLLYEAGGKKHLAEIKLSSAIHNLSRSVRPVPAALKPTVASRSIICTARRNMKVHGVDYVSAWSIE
jgi:hypothetical protein